MTAGETEQGAPLAEAAREPLLERGAELTALGEMLAGARGERGAVALIEAPGGLGKTRLLDAAASQARSAGMEVLRARGSELESAFSFGVALQLFEPRLRSARGSERRRLLQGSAGLARDLLSGGAGLGEASAGEQREFSLMHGLYWLAANLAELRPLLLYLDDAHLADAMSLRFLVYLAQRIGDLPLALAASVRPGEGAQGELVAQLEAQPATRLLRPRPLSPSGAAELLERLGFAEADRDGAFARACHRATAGNPLLLRELASALIAEGVEPNAAGAARALEIGPEPVSRAVFLALSRLPAAATALARAVAVLGEAADLPVAAELAELDEPQAAAAAGALIDAGVFERSERPTFLHPIVRAAIYEELKPAERSAAHASAAERLCRRHAPPEVVAGHLLESPAWGRRETALVLREAARRAVGRGSPATAAVYLERALAEHAGDEPDLLLELFRAQATAGDAAAVETVERALPHAGAAPGRARLLAELGEALYAHGRFGDSAAAYERALEELGGADDELRLELEAGRAASSLWTTERDPSALEPLLRHAERAATVPERAALANLAGAEMMRAEDRERTVALALLAWGDGELLRQASAAQPAIPAITGALVPAGELEAALAVTDAMIADARARGLALPYATARFIRSNCLLELGLLDEALADAEEALATRPYGGGAFLPAALWVHTICRIERGELDAGERALLLAPEEGERLAGSPAHALVLHGQAELALARGDAAEAVRCLREGGAPFAEAIGSRNPAFYGWMAPLATALTRLGQREEARELAEENLRLARRWGAPGALATALAARGLVERAVDALPWLEEAVAVSDGPGSRLRWLRALVDLGALRRAAGRRAEAREALRAALDAADRAGARVLAARAREELVALGVRPRRQRISGPEALTPSERRVAEMAAGGMSNRQIAEALFVTLKAVEYHLRNVYLKLDVKGRGELARALAAKD